MTRARKRGSADQVSEAGWRHRPDLAANRVREVWYRKDLGICVRTRLGWFAGNGHRGWIGEMVDTPVLIAPMVGPCPSHTVAIESYMAALDLRRTA